MREELSEEGTADVMQEVYPHFLPLSNMLVTPRLLHCPTDTRLPARNFSELRDDNLSYFVAVNAEFGRTTMILAGDRNLAQAGLGPQSVYQVGTNNLIHWTRDMHHWKGNLLFADGHVDKADGLRLVSSGSTQFSPAELLVPSTGSGLVYAVAPEPFEPTGEEEFSPQGALPDQSTNGAPDPSRHSRSGFGMAPLGTTQSSPSGSRDTLSNQPPSPSPTPMPAGTNIAGQPRQQPETATQTMASARSGLWLLLLLVVAALAYRLWRAWRRYCEKMGAPET